MEFEKHMQVGVVGLGRMGSNIVRRLLRSGHECIVFDQNPALVRQLVGGGATGCERSCSRPDR